MEALRAGLRDLGYTEGKNIVFEYRLELLKDAMPRIKRVAVLLNSDNPVNNGPIIEAMEPRAKSLNIGLQQFGARGPDDFESALAAIAKRRMDAS